jgi:hypothetical protein
MATNIENQNTDQSLFENGATWLRADFHLHTIKDKEFKFDGNPNDFFNQYIDRLIAEKINVGIITNHNKFDKEEYSNLRKHRKKIFGFFLVLNFPLMMVQTAFIA